MRVVVILDVKPQDGEPGRTGEQVREAVEEELDRMAIDVDNASGNASAHAVEVIGIGADTDAAEESRRLRARR